VLEPFGHLHDELGVFDELLGHEAVQKIDASLVVFFMAGDVVAADEVEQRRTWPANGARAVVPGFDMRDVGSDFFDNAEHFVPEHEEIEPLGRPAIQRLIDFGVSCIDADLQRPHDDAPPRGRGLREGGRWQFGDVGRMLFSRGNCESFHGIAGETKCEGSSLAGA
jgi:hypothetical protein